MRRGENDLLYVDKDGQVHFPDDWTEEAKVTWFNNVLSAGKNRNTPSTVPVVKIKGIYGLKRGEPWVDSKGMAHFPDNWTEDQKMDWLLENQTFQA